MGWWIECSMRCNSGGSWAHNIVELLDEHSDPEGWFQCQCGARGYILKSYKLQEPGETWKPILKGAIRCGDSENETYKPFVFLVGYERNGAVDDVWFSYYKEWFSYYKDLRGRGGKLKLGYGPGGPPVLGKNSVLELVSQLVHRECVTLDEVRERFC